MSLTSYAQKKFGDAMLGKAAFPTITTQSLALLTSNPGESGSLASELSGGSYARQRIDNVMAAFDATLGTSSNTSAVTFPVPTANWNTFAYVGVVDNSGNMWWFEALPIPITKVNGDVAASFQIGAITMAFDLTWLTSFAAKKFGDAMLNKAAFPAIAALYQGLFTGNPGAAGSQATEVVGAGYTRKDVSSVMSAFDAVTGRAASVADLKYPDPAGTWGTPAYVAWLDASSAGNMWMRDQLPATRNIILGSAAPQFLAGSTTASID